MQSKLLVGAKGREGGGTVKGMEKEDKISWTPMTCQELI